MAVDIRQEPDDALARLIDEVNQRLLALPGTERHGFVGSELPAVNRVLSHIQAEGLARGPVFCDWGSGLGGACGVAALNGFNAFGIEIQHELVDSARSLAEDLEFDMIFAEGTYLLPGDEDLFRDATIHTRLAFNDQAWKHLNLAPNDCDIVFAYPWPSEEVFIDRVFARHAAPDALLLTFHDFDRVLVQRKLEANEKLLPLGWM